MRYLVIILGLVTALVLLLLSVLAYLVTRRGPRRHTDKCSVRDSQGEAAPGLLSQPLVTCAGESLQFTTSLHSPDPAHLRGPEVSCGGSARRDQEPPQHQARGRGGPRGEECPPLKVEAAASSQYSVISCIFRTTRVRK